MNYAYIRPLSYQTDKIDRKRQEEALQALATLRGIRIDSSDWRPEPSVDGFSTFQGMLQQVEPGDIVLIASPEVLGSMPSLLLEHSTQLAAEGAEVLVASTGGSELDLPAIRQYVRPMIAVEEENRKLAKQIEEERREHTAEFKQFQKRFEDEVSRLLTNSGISLTELLRTKNDPKPAQPKDTARGASLKEKRERLGLTQEQAANLPKGAFSLNKTAISRMESEGRGPHINDYEGWLNAEAVRRARYAKGSVNGQPGNPNEPLNLG